MSPAAAVSARRGRVIGRDAELAAMRDLVLHGDGRLVTLTGAGGCGKTTLALESARRLEGAMADGAAVIDLAVVRDPETVALACCESLGLVEQSRPPDAVLEAHLAPRQMLIVLDNCEHLVSALHGLIDRLLDSCPDLRVLATSRARLRVRGESVFVVPPLPVPGTDVETDPDQLRRVAAVELFVERATSVNPAFQLDDWAPAVASIGTYPSTCSGGIGANYTTTSIEGVVTVAFDTPALFDQAKAVKSGANLAIKVQLLDATGSNLSSAGISVRLATPIALTGPNGTPTARQPSGSFAFVNNRDNGPMYQYDLKTAGLGKGIYTLSFTVEGDPSSHTLTFRIG